MNMDTSVMLIAPLLLTLLLLVPLIVLLNVYLVRLTWQGATQNMPGAEVHPAAKDLPGKEPPAFRPQRQGTSVLVILLILGAVGAIPLLLCAGVVATYWAVPSRSTPAQQSTMSHEHEPYVTESTPLRQSIPQRTEAVRHDE